MKALLLLPLLASMVAWPAPSSADWVSTVQRVEPAVVRLAATDGLDLRVGAGFFIADDGSLVTCYHVIAGVDGHPLPYLRATLRGDGPREVVFRVVATDPARDLALLRPVDPHFRPAATLRLSTRLPDVGQYVIAIGHPTDGQRWSVTSGLIGAHVASTTERPIRRLQTEAALNPGNSGGPIIDAGGGVVGISRAVTHRAGGHRAEGLNRAIAAVDVATWLAGLRQTVGRAPPAPRVTPVLPVGQSTTIRRMAALADRLRDRSRAFESQGRSVDASLPAPR